MTLNVNGIKIQNNMMFLLEEKVETLSKQKYMMKRR